jgi:polysaccharide deacetylase 2 family uncharacterized protein YibQ
MRAVFNILFLAILFIASAHAEGLPAWKRNAVLVDVPPDMPKIVVIIDDLGEDRPHTRDIIALPGPLTLSYFPFPAHIADEVKAGKAAGHEIMMHMPMEPIQADLETGDYFLTTRQTPEQLKATLDKNLAAFSGYVGINNHEGSRLTGNLQAMDEIMVELRARGLLFVDSRTTPHSVAAQIAAAHKVPYTVRDVFLDDEPQLDQVKRQLQDVERIARRYGHAVAIGHPREDTIAALKEWLPSLKEKGFVLVPVSAVVTDGAPMRVSPAPVPSPSPPPAE